MRATGPATSDVTFDAYEDIQNFIYSVQYGARRHANLDELMSGLLPLLDAYAAARTTPLRAQLWDALGMPFVNHPEQWHNASSRAEEGQELRTILTRHLRDDETR